MTILKDASKPLSEFDALVKDGAYVDKTRFLRPLLEDGGARLFTRPRGFGKGTGLLMLRDFLELDYESPGNTERQERIFRGLAVMEDQELCHMHMGQHPVILLSLCDAVGNTMKEAWSDFAYFGVSIVANRYRFLLDSPRLTDDDKRRFERILEPIWVLSKDENLPDMASAVSCLATLLHKHFERKVAVLVHGYDAPLNNAQLMGFLPDLEPRWASFLGFLEDAGSDAPDNPYLGVFATGRLPFAIASLGFDARCIRPNSVLSENQDFSALFGFTRDEVEELFSRNGLERKSGEAWRKCGGFWSGQEALASPGAIASMAGPRTVFWQDPSGRSSLLSEDYGSLGLEAQARSLLGGGRGVPGLMEGMGVDIDLASVSCTGCALLEGKAPQDILLRLLHEGMLTHERNDQGIFGPDNPVRARLPNTRAKDLLAKALEDKPKDHYGSSEWMSELKAGLFQGSRPLIREAACGLLKGLPLSWGWIERPRNAEHCLGLLSSFLAMAGFLKEPMEIALDDTEDGRLCGSIFFTDRDHAHAVVIGIMASSCRAGLFADARKALGFISSGKACLVDEKTKDKRIRTVMGIGMSFFLVDCDACSRILFHRG